MQEEQSNDEISKDIKILGMKKEENEFMYYVVESNGNELWVKRDFIMKNTTYLVNLCEFYEQRIVFST